MPVCVFSGHLTNAATELMKLDHEEPQLTEPYLSKQKKLMVSVYLGFRLVAFTHYLKFHMKKNNNHETHKIRESLKV